MNGITATEVGRELWRRKLWVLGALAIALAAGTFVASRGFTVERASTDILLDTPRSQAVDVGTRSQQGDAIPQIDTLSTRARLLGNLMASGSIKRAVARRAGMSSDRLIVLPPPDAETTDESSNLRETSDAEKPDAVALTVTTDSTLPILHVVAQAPSAETAEQLARGAVTSLRDYLGTVAAADEIPEAQRLDVHEIGFQPARATTGGPGTSAALVVALIAFAAGCALIVAVSREVESRAHGEQRSDPGAEADSGFVVRMPGPVGSRNGVERETREPSRRAGD